MGILPLGSGELETQLWLQGRWALPALSSPTQRSALTRTSAHNPGGPRVCEHSLQRESTGGLLESFQMCVKQHQDESAGVPPDCSWSLAAVSAPYWRLA